MVLWKMQQKYGKYITVFLNENGVISLVSVRVYPGHGVTFLVLQFHYTRLEQEECFPNYQWRQKKTPLFPGIFLRLFKKSLKMDNKYQRTVTINGFRWIETGNKSQSSSWELSTQTVILFTEIYITVLNATNRITFLSLYILYKN